MDSRLAIKHINAQSIKNKLNLLELEAEEYDFITISETWLRDGIKSEDICIESFNPPMRRDRTADRYGGVAVYFRVELPVKERTDFETPGVEAAWVETTICNKQILVGVVYRPLT